MNKMRLKAKKKRRFSFKFFLLFIIFLLSLYFSFDYLCKQNINIDNKELVYYLLEDASLKRSGSGFLKKQFSSFAEPYNLLNMKVAKLYNKEKKAVKEIEVKPLVYLYNSHQTEEYAKTTLAEYAVNPTVTINNYIMLDVFQKNNINTITEERSIREVLNLNSWNYAASYKASRIYMEDVKKEYPSLKYFIDLHRDSLKKDKTTIQIGDKSYAKIIFLIGLENVNYQKNLAFTEEINNKIGEKYPGLSKGIYKKGGAGVNGVYNQDFSPYTILIEIGGCENTTSEVLNTVLAISEVISEVIINNEQKELG